MTWPDVYLFCFALGTAWALISFAFGGLHVGHGHFAHAHVGKMPAKLAIRGAGPFGYLLNPSSAAVFLAWFGGVGYLLTRYSGLVLWLNVLISVALGFAGAFILAYFLRFLLSKEEPLDPLDYDMVGVLGNVSSTIRPDGFGEVLYVQEGTRRAVPARSEDGVEIGRGQEVIVVRHERGIAYVRTWEAMTQRRRS